MKEIVLDIEIIPDPKAVPFIPERGPKDRTDPWEKLIFDSNFNRICVVGFYDGKESSSVGIDDRTEPELLETVWSFLKDYDRIVTFNGMTFDIPFLYKRSWFHGVRPQKAISVRRYDVTNHVDVRAVLSNWDGYARGNLDLYGALKLDARKTEGITGADVSMLWASGQCELVHSYCCRDCMLTWQLYQSLKGFYLPVDPSEEQLPF